MSTNPPVEEAVEFGNTMNFWVEYPSGLVDLTRTVHLPKGALGEGQVSQSQSAKEVPVPPLQKKTQLEFPVEHNRVVRIEKSRSAIVIIDMQNFFLHSDLMQHPTGLACVDSIMKVVPALRSQGIKVIWCNWGLTEHELNHLPPVLLRSFTRNGRGGFGQPLPGKFGRLLMRGEYNTDLYGPLKGLYEEGQKAGTDVWIHKNRVSGLSGPQSSLDLYLQENGIDTLFFAGINADQCVLGTLFDCYFRGYDCITLKDAVATTSPSAAMESLFHNSGRLYGFNTDTDTVIAAASK